MQVCERKDKGQEKGVGNVCHQHNNVFHSAFNRLETSFQTAEGFDQE